MDSLHDVARRPVLEAAADINGAIVYLDAGAAEVAQLSWGASFLFGIGAANVCELERPHPDDALLPSLAAGGSLPSALALLTTQLLTDAHPYIVHALVVHPYARRCIIFSAVSEHAHALSSCTQLGVEAYSEYAAALRQDVVAARAAAAAAAAGSAAAEAGAGGGAAAGRPPLAWEAAGEQVEVAVRHLPLHVAAVDSSAFVLPAASAAATLAIAGGRPAGFGPADPTPEDDNGVGVSGGLSLLASALVDVCAQLRVRVTPFALGPVSQQIAREVASLPQPLQRDFGDDSGSGAPSSMALLLLDRSLDLASPCGHSEHPLDAMAALLQRPPPAPLPPHSRLQQHRVAWRPLDLRAPPPQPLPAGGGSSGGGAANSADCAAPSAPLPPPLARLRPSIFNPEDRRAVAALEQLVQLQPRGALLQLRKLLKDALRSEKLSPAVRSKLGGGVGAAELAALVASLAAEPGALLRQLPAAALGGCAAAAMAGDAWVRWEALRGLERQVVAVLAGAAGGAGGGQALQETLMDAVETAAAGKGLLQVDDLLQLLLLTYSLCGDLVPPAPPMYSAGESALRDALTDALLALAGDGDGEAGGGGADGPEGVGAGSSGGRALQGLDCLPDVAEWLLRARSASAGGSGAEGGDSEVRAVVAARASELFTRLRWVAAQRGKLRDVRRLLLPAGGDGGAPAATPLLRLLLSKVLLRGEVRELWQPEGARSLGGLLSRGLGRLGLSGVRGAGGAGTGAGAGGRPQPSDFPAVCLFVVGGISAAELREARQELAQHSFGHQPLVLLGGTALLTPADTARLALA